MINLTAEQNAIIEGLAETMDIARIELGYKVISTEQADIIRNTVHTTLHNIGDALGLDSDTKHAMFKRYIDLTFEKANNQN